MVSQNILERIPEFQRFQAANPENILDEIDVINTYGRAIHWGSILTILCPDFTTEDYYMIETFYFVYNDPDRQELPKEFLDFIQKKIALLWTLQLEKLYPQGDWEVKIWDDIEGTVDATIKKRG